MKLIKIEKGKAPEPLDRFKEDIFKITGLKKLDKLCTVLALTQNLKHVVNTDSCDYYQFEKFNKQDISDMAADLVEIANIMQEDKTCWDCQYLLASAHSHVDKNMPDCGHPDAPDESGIPDLNKPPEWCPISEERKEHADWLREYNLIGVEIKHSRHCSNTGEIVPKGNKHMYEKEIGKIIKTIGLENLEPEILEAIKKQMEKDLKVGVENGYSVEYQVGLALALKSKLEELK